MFTCARRTRRSLVKALQVRIRKVQKGDVDRIVDIERSWHHLSHWSIDSYYRLLTDDNFTSSFVAEMEDEYGRFQIVGFVIFHVAADISEIYNIAVESRNARSGIGRQLMAAAIDESERRHARKVVLEVRKSNDAAINFYLGFHFRIAGERKNYYSNPAEDAYVMELDISD
ncbi:MAG: ribosomal-protein-alanine N-acetyltransferase [Acidobacteria bacterium]|nr:MAG: ribosomal-protein-alanine N-acetyltransferase [Acidobacteriota bacterium]